MGNASVPGLASDLPTPFRPRAMMACSWWRPALAVSVMSVSGGSVPSAQSCGSSTSHSLLCCYRPQEFPQGDSTPA